MLLKKILSAMRGGEQVKLVARRMPDGNCEAIVTTVFAEPPKDLDPALLQLRATLCRPIIIRASDDALDADLNAALDAHEKARNEAVNLLQSGIADLEAATKAVRNAGSKGKKKDAPAKAGAKPAATTNGEETEEEEEAGAAEAPAAAAEPAKPAGVDLFAET